MIKTISFTEKGHEDRVAELNHLLQAGYEIILSSTDIYDAIAWYEFVLYKADDTQPVATNARWDAITSIEGAETYSKSQGKLFRFWRCQLASGQKVNIFDHPDDARNTFKIVAAVGWEDTFSDINLFGIALEEFYTPIPCWVSSDGEWLSLVSIMSHEIYQEHFDLALDNIPEWAKEAELEPYPLPNKSKEFSEFINILHGGDYLILDTETTDLDGEICEISIIDSNGKVLLDTLVKPVGAITPGAARIHGIINEMVANAPSWKETREGVKEIIKGKNLIIYNVAFDFPMMVNTDKRHDVFEHDTWIEIPKSVHCAMKAYAEHHGNWNNYHGSYTWVKLSEAAVREGIKVENAHRALGDCQMTLAVCKALLKHYQVGE
jgi:DNA polymerase-3 subunit epsilon